MPVAGVGAGVSGADSHGVGKTRTDTHTGRKHGISEISRGISHQQPLGGRLVLWNAIQNPSELAGQ